MATIKSYTDISQSKTLSKILPLESADMCYICIDICKGLKYMPEPQFIKNIPDHADEYDIRCWSLAALLGVLPDGSDIIKEQSDDKDGKYMCTVGYKNDILSTFSDNPVDACVAMIEKLHELKML